MKASPGTETEALKKGKNHSGGITHRKLSDVKASQIQDILDSSFTTQTTRDRAVSKTARLWVNEKGLPSIVGGHADFVLRRSRNEKTGETSFDRLNLFLKGSEIRSKLVRPLDHPRCR